MRVRLRIANVAKETGALLAEYLEERGLVLNEDAPVTISYGIPSNASKALNGECGGGDKIRRLVQMQEGGVKTVPWFEGAHIPHGFHFPALARMAAGHGGEDIIPVFQAEEVPWRVKAGWGWFSSYIPVETEFRVWIFRDECLDTYEKIMHRPNAYQYIGRNFRNGFDFVYCQKGPCAAIAEAKKAVAALDFDFGAVDVLLGKDGKFYVLEVNTAPGVLKSHAEATLRKLADRMVKWVDNGCPERS